MRVILITVERWVVQSLKIKVHKEFVISLTSDNIQNIYQNSRKNKYFLFFIRWIIRNFIEIM